MGQSIDITGQRFGRLVALRLTARGSQSRSRSQRWAFKCDCGNEVELRKRNVMYGGTLSCGCLSIQTTVERSTTHGHAKRGSASCEYRSWADMHTRCGNRNRKDYKDYGARGITVCERWESFENFLADLGFKPSPQHSLDRIDPNGNYEPGNVRWATPIEQANNKRTNRLLTIGGQEATIAEHAREASIPYEVLLKRVNAGWSTEILAALLRIYRERAEGAGVRP
jgi:hypothetical protein